MSARLDVNQRHPKSHQTILAKLCYHAIAEPGVRIRIRLRENNLHILCESHPGLQLEQVIPRLMQALKSHPGFLQQLTRSPEHSIRKIILYGRTLGKERPDWVEPIVLNQLVSQPTPEEITPVSACEEESPHLENPETIARYLSESFSRLGVSVKVFQQQIPTAEENNAELSKRLLVFCYCNYSPEPSLLAEPLAQKLRELELVGVDDAFICAQVSGEESLDWVVRVDLTPSAVMLQEWARWGDTEAIARLLNQALELPQDSVRIVLKDTTLHLFCPSRQDAQKTAETLTQELEAIAPQGIESATLYGVKDPTYHALDSSIGETVDWLERIDLPAATQSELVPSTLSLAEQGNLDALCFLLQRLLNPNLDSRLATGGIQLQLRHQGDLLHVMSEGIICPPQADIVQPVERLLRQFLLADIAGIRIYGRRSGQATPLWSYGVDFVSRKGKIEASPEFAAPNVDMAALVHIPKQEDCRENPEPEEATVPLLQASVAALQLVIGDLLCATRLFVPAHRPQSLQSSPSQSWNQNNFSPHQGIKVAFVWSILGILLTVQTDWFLARLLQNQAQAEKTQELLSSVTQETPEAFDLGSFSLQKTNPNEDTFNVTGFTQAQVEPAAQTAILAAARSSNPTLNNAILDEKLALYQEYIAKKSPPDILIIGSSRAMRGINPQVLTDSLASQGHPDISIYNFGINGATAQVVDLILRQLITADKLPKMVIWADGARAFNSGRPDITYEAIASSPGYEKLQVGLFPRASTPSSQVRSSVSLLRPETLNDWLNNNLSQFSLIYSQRNRLKTTLREQWVRQIPLSSSPSTISESATLTELQAEIDITGFLPISSRFQPELYYENYARVLGAYDSDYATFNLQGQQDEALKNVLAYLQQQNIPLVFVNTPLTDDYLDSVRREYEQQFQTYMRQRMIENGLIFRDLGQLWPQNHHYFSDPSHLNRYGATQVSQHLAQDKVIPWPSPSPNSQ